MLFAKWFFLIFVLLIHSACNPIYVMQAAYEQSKILIARRPLTEVIEDPQTSADDKLKLELVQKAQTFTGNLSLEAGKTFTTYTKLTRDPVAWVISASKKDSFTAYTWWYPIVGSVPYSGFFDKEDAVCSAKELQEDNYETWVRGTAAFSTLGWFNDPLLSSTLKLNYIQLVNTIIHETVHANIWIPNAVAFNESLANYIGSRGAVEFFKGLHSEGAGMLDVDLAKKLFEQSKVDFEEELDLSDCYLKLVEELTLLYNSQQSYEEKIQSRELILDRLSSDIKKKYPELRLLSTVNNAEIMQRRLYLTKLRDFDRLFTLLGSDWSKFIQSIKDIKEKEGADDEESFRFLDELNAGLQG